MEVEFNEPPQILYTYTQDEVTNPTIIKNSYSKTVTIVGTNKNNTIFGHFWNLERVTEYGTYNGVFFNSSRKTPFTLYVNGEIYESGYCKLSEVRKTGNGIEYDIDLYGGLSQFFYGLTTNEQTGNKLKLSDLDYDVDLDFTINKETVRDAWDMADEKYNTINFAPSYNGYPKSMDCDKVLINTKDSPIMERCDSEGRPLMTPRDSAVFSAYGGSYVLAELPEKLTEWEVADLRSGQQRPVIRMKSIVEACGRYMAKPENGGWSVDYDSDFFSTDNPYWENAWVTLPLLSEMNYINERSDETGVTPTISLTKVSDTKYTINGLDGKYGTVSFSGRLRMPLSASSKTKLYTSQRTSYWRGPFQRNTRDYDGAIVMRIRAYDSLNNIITETPAQVMTSDSTVNIQDAVVYNGCFERKDGYYYWTDGSGNTTDLRFDVNLMGRGFDRLELRIEWRYNTYIGKPGVLYADRYVKKSNANSKDVRELENGLSLISPLVAYTGSNTFSGTRLSGSKFTKEVLLDTKSTPCDYLLSYCKMFNLHFMKDVDSNTIHIMTRKNYYKRGEVVDLEKLVDRSREITINPTVFDRKWYDFKNDVVEGVFATDYKNTTSFDYGVKRINTGYDFDGAVKNLFDGNAIKGAVQAVEKSKYFTYYDRSDNGVQTWMLDGFSYDLYGVSDSSSTKEIKIDAQPFDMARGISNNKYFDISSKPQFHGDDNNPVDGSNVLLFWNGSSDLVADDSTSLKYWLTDDLDVMYMLNGQSCWLCTNNEYDKNNERIAIRLNSIPHFTRYREKGSTIAQSWDFGQPRQLYIPDLETSESSTIYDAYWKSYIEDMYDIDTKVLDCYVRLENRPNPEWLRRFYWFDNSIWRINKISDWNVSDYSTTKMQFIKVQDMDAYSNRDASIYGELTITADRYVVSDTGGTVTFTVTTTDGGCWVGDDAWDIYFGSIPSGCGYSTTFTVDIPAYGEGRVMRLNVIGEQDQRGNGVQITQKSVIFTVTEFANYSHSDVPQAGGTCLYTVRSTYSWTVTSDRTYCVPRTSSGTGNTEYGETLSVDWSMSDTYGSRSATLTFTDLAGNVVTKIKAQDGVDWYNLHFDYTGGTETLSAPVGGNVTTKPEWVEVIDNGDGTYSVVAEYNSGDYRSGVIVLQYPNGDTFTVIAEQEAYQGEGAEISGNTSHLNVKQYGQYVGEKIPQTGGTVTYNVKSTSSWTVVSDSPYCVPQTTSGSGNTIYGESVSVVWDGNDGYETRCATLTFTNNEHYTVKAVKCQEEMRYTGATAFTVSTDSLIYMETGGTQYVSITNPYGDEWRVVEYPSWMSVGQIQGNGDAILGFTAEPYDGMRRYGTIRIYDITTGTYHTISVLQYGEQFERMIIITPNPKNVGGDSATTFEVNVEYIGRDYDFVIANPSTTDITVGSIVFTGENATVSVTIAPNPSYSARTEYVTFEGSDVVGQLVINQEGSTPRLIVNPDSFTFTSSGGTATFDVDANDKWDIN